MRKRKIYLSVCATALTLASTFTVFSDNKVAADTTETPAPQTQNSEELNQIKIPINDINDLDLEALGFETSQFNTSNLSDPNNLAPLAAVKTQYVYWDKGRIQGILCRSLSSLPTGKPLADWLISQGIGYFGPALSKSVGLSLVFVNTALKNRISFLQNAITKIRAGQASGIRIAIEPNPGGYPAAYLSFSLY